MTKNANPIPSRTTDQITNAYVVTLIEAGEYDKAIQTLETNGDSTDSTGQTQSILGLAYFLNEDYHNSVLNYELALLQEPRNLEWQAMLNRAKSNVKAEAVVAVPAFKKLVKAELLGFSNEQIGTLPEPILAAKQRNIGKRIKRSTESVLGIIGDGLMHIAVNLVGLLTGYKESCSKLH